MSLREKISSLPQAPGIYIMLDKKGNVLYVGKARSLKKRVSSYFTRGSSSLKTERLKEEIGDIKYFITKSEVDALILECSLIKRFHPPYNIDYKDDKSYPFIRITKELFPSISLVRIPPSLTADYLSRENCILFGPYPKVKLVKEALRKIRKVFPLRSCTREIGQNKSAPLCLDYHVGLCAGPCQNLIEVGDYRALVRRVYMLLKGERRGLMKELRKKMYALSKQLKFEEAARIRNQLLGLEEITGTAESGSFTEAKTGGMCSLPLQELQSALNLPSLPVHIEGLDISNLGGDFATGAVVVFKNGVPYKNGYRHFGIKTVQGVNDVQMLAEIARRHYSQISLSITCSTAIHSAGSFLLPDLILVDGGIGQLKAVSNVLKELKLKVPVISIAKKFEEVFKEENGRIKKILLSLTSPGLHLLQYIRDEAHRFAIKYHKILRDREMKKSVLDGIRGIGEKRKQKLLSHFGSIEKVMESSIEELKGLGIPEKIAQQILETGSTGS